MAWKMYGFRKYPVVCKIYAWRQNKIIGFSDYGRRFIDERGETYYRLKNLKKNTVPFSQSDIYRVERDDNQKKKKIDILYLFSPSPSFYFPIKLNAELEASLNNGNYEIINQLLPDHIKIYMDKMEANKEIKIPINEKAEQWFDWESFRIYKNNILTQDSSLEKYIPHIILIVIVIAVGITVYLMYGGMVKMMDSASASEQRWIQSNERWQSLDQQLIDMVKTGTIKVTLTNTTFLPTR